MRCRRECRNLAEILLTQAIERSAKKLGRAADEVVNLGLERRAVRQKPCFRRDVAIVSEYALDAPVQRLARQPVAALQKEYLFARGRQPVCERAAARAAADDDDVVSFGHRGLQSHAVVHYPAIRKNCRRGQIASSLAGKEHHYVCDLFRLSHAAEWDRGIQLRHQCRVVHRDEVDRGRDRARTDPDDQNAVRANSTPAVRVSIRIPPLDRQ